MKIDIRDDGTTVVTFESIDEHRAVIAGLDDDRNHPPPVLGPKPVGIRWLLEQQVWWYPLRRPAVRVASMDKPWRWNTVRFLERRAERYKLMDDLDLFTGGLAADMPDDVANDILREPAVEWLHRQPLVRALSRGLPHPATTKGRAMAARAIHWHTCPMRQAHPGRLDRCLCVRRDNRVVGAINDPTSLAVAP